jgi:hypothetical protein
MRAAEEFGNTTVNTRASRRMPASETSTGTAMRSSGTGWIVPTARRAA